MDVFVNEVIYEKDLGKKPVKLPKGIPEPHREVMQEFLQSVYIQDNSLCMGRFLEEDRTIDLEKLELAVQLLIEYLEFLNKSKRPIYVFLGCMSEYFDKREINLKDIDRLAEESSFILGFVDSVAQEFSIERKVIVQFRRKE